MVQLSHPYSWKNQESSLALTRWTFVGKVMSLLFNMLPRFVIAFLPRSKHLLIPWPRSSSAVILEPEKIKRQVTQPDLYTQKVVPDNSKMDEYIPSPAVT